MPSPLYNNRYQNRYQINHMKIKTKSSLQKICIYQFFLAMLRFDYRQKKSKQFCTAWFAGCQISAMDVFFKEDPQLKVKISSGRSRLKILD